MIIKGTVFDLILNLGNLPLVLTTNFFHYTPLVKMSNKIFMSEILLNKKTEKLITHQVRHASLITHSV